MKKELLKTQNSQLTTSTDSRCIVTASDSNYFPGLMGLLRSLKKTNPDIPVIVFDGGLTGRQKKKAGKFAGIIKKEPIVNIEGRGKFSYIGTTTLLKFNVCELDCEKVLYLDADIIVRSVLDNIFELPPGKVGVVRETNAVKNMFRPKDRDRLMTDIDIAWGKPGFNAGVFLLRPAEWRELPRKIRDLVSTYGEEVFSKSKDQQLLNIVFNRHIYDMDEAYNFSPFYDDAAKVEPAILHYLTERKPWHKYYPDGYYYEDYRKNIKISDYPDIIRKDIIKTVGVSLTCSGRSRR